MMRRVWSRLSVPRPRTRPEVEAEVAVAQPPRGLDEAIHRILIVGLVVSASLFLVGLGLSLVEGQPLPTQAMAPGEALRQMLAMQPAGFLSLGLIVLIATPMLRVAGSVLVFAWQRDWRYVGITCLVLLVMIASVLLGRGG